jgi:tetratricopeptide (TPR) repeat protein
MKRLALAALVACSLVGIGVGAYVAYDWIWGAEAHWRAAQEAAKRHDFAEAYKHVTLYLRAKPDKAEAHLLAARVARRAVQPRVVETDEDLDAGNSAQASVAVGSYEEAEKHLQKYKRLGGLPQLVQLEHMLAQAQRGELEGVEEQLRTWVEKDNHPETALILEALAKGYLVTYRLAEAGQTLDRLLMIDESPQALYLRAWMAFRGQDIGRAVELYTKILELEPENEKAELQLATILRLAAKPQDALPRYQRLHQARPWDRAVTLGLAETELALGQTEAARRLLDPLLKDVAECPEAFMILANLEWREKHADTAEAVVRKVLAQRPWDRSATLLLMQCDGHRGNKEELPDLQARLDGIQYELFRLDEVTRRIVTAPKDAMLRWEAGAIMIGCGQPKAGLRWLRTALEVDPKHQPTLRLLQNSQTLEEGTGGALFRNAHEALADYYDQLSEPRFKTLAAYHRQILKALRQAPTVQPSVPQP